MKFKNTLEWKVLENYPSEKRFSCKGGQRCCSVRRVKGGKREMVEKELENTSERKRICYPKKLQNRIRKKEEDE